MEQHRITDWRAASPRGVARPECLFVSYGGLVGNVLRESTEDVGVDQQGLVVRPRPATVPSSTQGKCSGFFSSSSRYWQTCRANQSPIDRVHQLSGCNAFTDTPGRCRPLSVSTLCSCPPIPLGPAGIADVGLARGRGWRRGLPCSRIRRRRTVGPRRRREDWSRRRDRRDQVCTGQSLLACRICPAGSRNGHIL